MAVCLVHGVGHMSSGSIVCGTTTSSDETSVLPLRANVGIMKKAIMMKAMSLKVVELEPGTRKAGA